VTGCWHEPECGGDDFDTAHSIVQATVTDDLPPLVAAAQRLLRQVNPDGER
jgi:hypothetical protein